MSHYNFPVEIWREVFRQATFMPFLLDTEWNCGPEGRSWLGWPRPKKQEDTEIDTKRAIVRVCREWRDIGLEFLWEEISIQGVPDIKILLDIFESSVTGPSAGSGYGWRTKRLTCNHVLFDSRTESHTFVLCLLEQLHNLQILAIAGYGPEIPTSRTRIANTIQTRFSHSLRRIDCHLLYPEEAHFVGRGDPYQHAVASPTLRLTSLSIRIEDELFDQLMPSYLSNLSTLSLQLVRSKSVIPSQWICPRLRTLKINYRKASVQPGVVTFIGRHHATLRHLCITRSPTLSSSGLEQIISCICAAKYLQSFTADQITVGLLAYHPRSGDGMDQNVSITHFGVLRTDMLFYYERVRSGIRLVGVGNPFPNVKAVRWLQITFPDRLTESNQLILDEINDSCREKGVRLEDGNGGLLNDKDGILYVCE